MRGALGVLVLALAAVPMVAATQGQYATWEPGDVSGEWRVSTSVRLCPTEAPLGDATLTDPAGATQNLVGDTEGCWSFAWVAEGLHTVEWTTAGGDRLVQAYAWGGEPVDWLFWLVTIILAGIAFVGFGKSWWFVGVFATAGLFAWVFEIPGIPFEEFTLPWVLVSGLLEIWVERTRQRRKDRDDK